MFCYSTRMTIIKTNIKIQRQGTPLVKDSIIGKGEAKVSRIKGSNEPTRE